MRRANNMSASEFSAWFWTRVDVRGDNECWPWRGARDGAGYGHTQWHGSPASAHRIAFETTNGPIPKGDGYHGTCVLHRCDNPPCCNPAHLRVGTHADNMADKVAKGRQAGTPGDSHWSRRYPERRPRGEHNGFAKLTELDVMDIRLARRGGEPQRSVARRFGVSPTCIRYIERGLTWTHLPL